MSGFINDDADLLGVLEEADENDLGVLADFITDSNKGRISLDSSVRVQLDTFKRSGTLCKNHDLIAKEIQEFGGNSIVNIFRGTGVPYREILNDVADHMNIETDDDDSAEQVELKILLVVAIKGMERMSPSDQREFLKQISGGKVNGLGPGMVAALQASILAGGFGSYILATTVAQAVAKTLIGRGLTFGATGGLMRGISVFTGPIGWAVTALWTAFDLASPAYRVTVPCVVQLAYMRQKVKGEEVPKCGSCGAAMVPDQKFCSECGRKS